MAFSLGYHPVQGIIATKRTITVRCEHGTIEITHTGFILDNHALNDTPEGSILRSIVRFDIDEWVVQHEGEKLPEAFNLDDLGYWLLHQVEQYNPPRHREG